MSWSASWTVDDGVWEDSSESNVALEYHADQYREALDAAWGLIKSGVVGDPDAKYRVTLTGHGNPNHEPLSGWSNDFVSVAIYQV